MGLVEFRIERCGKTDRAGFIGSQMHNDDLVRRTCEDFSRSDRQDEAEIENQTDGKLHHRLVREASRPCETVMQENLFC